MRRIMSGTFNLKRVALLFAAVLASYLVIFVGIEHWRRMSGPWVVLFDVDERGRPSLVIEQDRMNVRAVRILLEDETVVPTNLPVRLTFDRPRQPLPFGRRLHEDLVQLPGVETFDLFGHIVELAPRRLALNGRHVPWQSDQTFRLWPTNKLSGEFAPAKSLRDTPARADGQPLE
jgi:hypothetical protein